MNSLKAKIAVLLAALVLVQLAASWWLYHDYTRNVESQGSAAIHRQGMARAQDFLARSLGALQMTQTAAHEVLDQAIELFTYSDSILMLLRKEHAEPLQHLAERMMANTELDAIMVHDTDHQLLATATSPGARWLQDAAPPQATRQPDGRAAHPPAPVLAMPPPEARQFSPLWITSLEITDPFGDPVGTILVARDSRRDHQDLNDSARALGVQWARYLDGRLIDGTITQTVTEGAPRRLQQYERLRRWGTLLAVCSEPAPGELQLCALMPRSRELAWEREIKERFDEASHLLNVYLAGDTLFFLLVVILTYLAATRFVIQPIRDNTKLLHQLLPRSNAPPQKADELTLLSHAVNRTRHLVLERQTLAAQAEFETYHDDITRLPNRRALNEFIADLENHPSLDLGVVFLRIRNFGRIHDQFGHRQADQALVDLAASLDRDLPDHWFVFYLGHDRFLLIAIGEAELGRATRQLLDRLEGALDTGPHLASAFLNLVATHVSNRDFEADLTTLFQYATIALSRNFDRPGQVFAVTTEEIAAHQRQLLMETHLATAVQKNELSLHYQPVCHSDDAGLCYFEALLRWHNPVLGEMPPCTFIPLAENVGLIGEIGRWALRQACAQLAEWDREEATRGIHLSLNISPLQLSEPGLAEMVLANLSQAGIAPHRLIIEITESAALALDEPSLNNLQTLREAGIHLSIDDFGEGYSSLGHLLRLRANTLKIDRQFVEAIVTDDTALSVIRGFVELARCLEMEVVAEGVENARQLELLRQAGCPAIQGFLLSRPMPAETAIRWYRRVGGCRRQRPRLA